MEKPKEGDFGAIRDRAWGTEFLSGKAKTLFDHASARAAENGDAWKEMESYMIDSQRLDRLNLILGQQGSDTTYLMMALQDPGKAAALGAILREFRSEVKAANGIQMDDIDKSNAHL